MILLISASWVVRITGVSQLHLALLPIFKFFFFLVWCYGLNSDSWLLSRLSTTWAVSLALFCLVFRWGLMLLLTKHNLPTSTFWVALGLQTCTSTSGLLLR
jgi:hypothetical protein